MQDSPASDGRLAGADLVGVERHDDRTAGAAGRWRHALHDRVRERDAGLVLPSPRWHHFPCDEQAGEGNWSEDRVHQQPEDQEVPLSATKRLAWTWRSHRCPRSGSRAVGGADWRGVPLKGICLCGFRIAETSVADAGEERARAKARRKETSAIPVLLSTNFPVLKTTRHVADTPLTVESDF